MPTASGRGPVSPSARARFAEVLDDTAHVVDAVRHRVESAGQAVPPVLVRGNGWESFRTAARVADVVLTAPCDAFGAAMIIEQVRDAEHAVRRTGPRLRILADLVVLLDDTGSAARARLERLDATDPLCTDSAVVATTPSALADMMVTWRRFGLDGYRLIPAVLPDDLHRIVDELVPALQRRGAFRVAYGEPTLRSRLGLDRAAPSAAA